jgi:hypothetical protein
MGTHLHQLVSCRLTMLLSRPAQQGHAGQLAYISEFVEEAKPSGLIQVAIEHAACWDSGLRLRREPIERVRRTIREETPGSEQMLEIRCISRNHSDRRCLVEQSGFGVRCR